MAHLKKDLKSLRKEIKDLWTMSDRQLATHESLVFAEIGAIKSDIAKRLQAWREATNETGVSAFDPKWFNLTKAAQRRAQARHQAVKIERWRRRRLAENVPQSVIFQTVARAMIDPEMLSLIDAIVDRHLAQQEIDHAIQRKVDRREARAIAQESKSSVGIPA
jgi:hypothetical protein